MRAEAGFHWTAIDVRGPFVLMSGMPTKCRLGILATLLATRVGDVPAAHAAGFVTHAWMALEAIDRVQPPALRALLDAHRDQVRAGAEFPDGGYWTRSIASSAIQAWVTIPAACAAGTSLTSVASSVARIPRRHFVGMPDMSTKGPRTSMAVQ